MDKWLEFFAAQFGNINVLLTFNAFGQICSAKKQPTAF
jgi:hypothetical protein